MTAAEYLTVKSGFPKIGREFVSAINPSSNKTHPLYIVEKRDDISVYGCEEGFGDVYEKPKAEDGRHASSGDLNNLNHVSVQGSNDKIIRPVSSIDTDVRSAIGGFPEGAEGLSDETGVRFISFKSDNNEDVVTRSDYMQEDAWAPYDNRIGHVTIEAGTFNSPTWSNTGKYPMEGFVEPSTPPSHYVTGEYTMGTFTAPFDFYGGIHPQTAVVGCGSFLVNGQVIDTWRSEGGRVGDAYTGSTGPLRNCFMGGMFFRAGKTYTITISLKYGVVLCDGQRMGKVYSYTTIGGDKMGWECPRVYNWCWIPSDYIARDKDYIPTDWDDQCQKLSDNSKLLYWRYILGVPGKMVKTGDFGTTVNPYNPKFPHWNSHETT